MQKILIPQSCHYKATVNYSIINQFKPANIYRFFCISLFRDKYYNVWITLKELAHITRDNTLSSFNKTFKDFLEIKTYREDKGGDIKPKRNVYHIPAKEPLHITLHRRFVIIELSSAVKGFLIQLILLSKFAYIDLTKGNIIESLGVDKKTFGKYTIDLIAEGLLSLKGDYLILHTENILLENDYKGQKKLASKHILGKVPPKITLNFKKEE